MNMIYLEKLEFYKITEMLNSFCCTYVGKELASQLLPCYEVDTVSYLLQETRRGS